MSYFGEEFKEYDRLPISIIDEAKVRLIKKGVNEGDYKNEDNKIVIKDVLDRLLTSYEKRVIRARKSAQKSRDKKKAEKAKELEQCNDENPTLTTELIADPPTERDEQVEQQIEKQVEQQVEKQAEKQVEKQVEMKVKPVFKRPEEPKKKHIWFS
jgi:hydroxylamine reductase (hybrid-cluster protein)